jgi:protein TonB
MKAVRSHRLVIAALLGACLAMPALADGPKVVKKVPPEFPADAGGVAAGTVRAKLAIDSSGKVTEVTILEATPRRVFDRAASSALMAWRFESTGQPQSYEVKLVFSED